MVDTRKPRFAAQPDDIFAARQRAPRTSSRIDPISAGLRALWASMEGEPVPGDFLALLDQMDADPVTAGEPPPGGPAA